MNDDQYLLASAYIDGELTPTERAAAEADPEVMAEVARLEALRRALADVAPPDAGSRAAGIAAAMAQFGSPTQGASQPTRAAAPIARAVRRFNWNTALGVAAAAVGVFAFGAILTVGLRGGGDDDAAMDDSVATFVADEDAERASGIGEAGMETRAAPEAVSSAAADTATAADATEPAAEPVGPAASSTNAPAVIASPEELADTGLALHQQHPDERTARSIDTACAFRAAVESPAATAEAAGVRARLDELEPRVELLGEAEYLYADGDVGPLLIAVDTDTGQTFGIDPVQCALTVVGPLP